MSILKIIRRLLNVTNINEDYEWFASQYPNVQVFIFSYLKACCYEAFKDPSLSNLGFSEEMYITMAARVGNYLLGNEKDKIEGEINDQIILNEIKMANRHVEKWADDIMARDKNFAELVVQTLRMDSLFKSYILDSNFKTGCDKYHQSPEGKRVFKLLMKYGKYIPKEPTPSSYRTLLFKWYMVSKKIEKISPSNSVD